MTDPLRKIVVVGGDMETWTVAAALAKGLAGQCVEVTVVERDFKSDRFAVPSVPSMLSFLAYLNIDEGDFALATDAAPSLGTAYQHWTADGQDFVHAFGPYGSMLDRVEFQHWAAKARAAGERGRFDDYSLGAVAGRLGRFAHPSALRPTLSSLVSYSITSDSDKYRHYLKSYALAHGVTLVDSEVADVTRDAATGFILALRLASGEQLDGDFFFDCSGSSATLIGESLGVPLDDWSNWLPYDSRVSVCPVGLDSIPLFVTMSAMDDGWSRSFSLRDRCVAELNYDSKVTPAHAAARALRQYHGAGPDDDVRHSRVIHGSRSEFWAWNCVAVGASAGSPGDLVVGERHLAQSAVLRWIDRYPTRQCAHSVSEDFNRACHAEFERILDAHVFVLNSGKARTTGFWQNVNRIPLTESLKHRVALFRARGTLAFYESETLLPQSWIPLLTGMGVWPERHDPLADTASDEEARARLERIRRQIRAAALTVPAYQERWTGHAV